MMWSVETSAGIRAAETGTGRSGWFQSGRLGTEGTFDHTTALAAVKALQEAGHKAWMSPAAGTKVCREAENGLDAYRTGRDGLVEAIHAALEDRMPKAEIARQSGLSRPGVDKIIDRYGLDRLVRGE